MKFGCKMICLYCKRNFEKNKFNPIKKKYCSDSCRKRDYYNKNSEKIRKQQNDRNYKKAILKLIKIRKEKRCCKLCGKLMEYKTLRSSRKGYCSKKCINKFFTTTPYSIWYERNRRRNNINRIKYHKNKEKKLIKSGYYRSDVHREIRVVRRTLSKLRKEKLIQ